MAAIGLVVQFVELYQIQQRCSGHPWRWLADSAMLAPSAHRLAGPPRRWAGGYSVVESPFRGFIHGFGFLCLSGLGWLWLLCASGVGDADMK